MDIKLSKFNIRKHVGGRLLTSILSLVGTLAPQLAKTIGLSALAGAALEVASEFIRNPKSQKSDKFCSKESHTSYSKNGF